jgi:hypothetical protein
MLNGLERALAGLPEREVAWDFFDSVSNREGGRSSAGCVGVTSLSASRSSSSSPISASASTGFTPGTKNGCRPREVIGRRLCTQACSAMPKRIAVLSFNTAEANYAAEDERLIRRLIRSESAYGDCHFGTRRLQYKVDSASPAAQSWRILSRSAAKLPRPVIWASAKAARSARRPALLPMFLLARGC